MSDENRIVSSEVRYKFRTQGGYERSEIIKSLNSGALEQTMIEIGRVLLMEDPNTLREVIASLRERLAQTTGED